MLDLSGVWNIGILPWILQCLLYHTTVLISLFKCMLSRKWVSLWSHLIINLHLQVWTSSSTAYSLFLHADVLLFQHTRWADFLAGTKQQRMRAQRMLPSLAADLSELWECESTPAWKEGSMAFSTCQQTSQCLQQCAKVPPGAPLLWQSDVSGTRKWSHTSAIHSICPCFTHLVLWEKGKLDNLIQLACWKAFVFLLQAPFRFLLSWFLSENTLKVQFLDRKKQTTKHQSTSSPSLVPLLKSGKWTSKFSFFMVVIPYCACEWVSSQKPVVREHCCISSVQFSFL